MKRILLIATGGTIASQEGTQGLVPAIPADELRRNVPGLDALADIECLQLLNLDSTNIAPEHWQMMAEAIENQYERYDGFVIAHGTDTMAYTGGSTVLSDPELAKADRADRCAKANLPERY